MTKEKQEFARFFREAQVSFSRFYSVALTSVDLTLPQYALLTQLSVSGTISMTEASKRLHVTKPAITNLVDRLEEKKCLRRIPHAKDRRIYLLEILSKGEKVVRNIQKKVFQILLQTLAEFSTHEKELIIRFYGYLASHIKNAFPAEEKTRYGKTGF